MTACIVLRAKATQTSPVARRYFVYDMATVNGATMANAKGRLAEAYTAVAPNLSTKITDEGFGYDIRGEMTDLYQSTPIQEATTTVPPPITSTGRCKV